MGASWDVHAAEASLIWLDGQRAPGMEVDWIPACGTIVVWTRLPGI
jgi:hypothetical protein